MAGGSEKAIVSLDLLKILIRLTKDIQALDNKKYLQLESLLLEIRSINLTSVVGI